MPGSRGSEITTVEKVDEWRSRTFEALRESRRRASSGADEAIPDDPIEDPEAARAAIDRFRSGE